MADSCEKGTLAGKLFEVISKEVEEFKKIIYQKSADFRDRHIFAVDNFSELEEKIKKGVIGLFLIPFCNRLDCEEKIKKKVPAYSIRCIKEINLSERKKIFGSKRCLFCGLLAENLVYFGRSY